MSTHRQRNLAELDSDRIKRINKVMTLLHGYANALYEGLVDEDNRAILHNCEKIIDIALDEKNNLNQKPKDK